MSIFCCCFARSGDGRITALSFNQSEPHFEKPWNEGHGVEELNDLFSHFNQEYNTKETAILHEDFNSNIPHVQLIRQNPDVVLKQGSKYSSHILELAKTRKFMISIRDRLAQFGENVTYEEEGIQNPMFQQMSGLEAKAGITPSNLRESAVSQRLSSRWNKRLEVTSLLSKVKPAWPEMLPEVEFDVVKLNRVGQSLPRKIKLTEFHVLNLRHDGILTKAYAYSDIRRVLLEEGDFFAIDLRNETRIRFSCSIAAHVVQQIIARIKFRLQIDRVQFDGIDAISHMSTMTTVNIIQQISMENAVGNSDAIMNFAIDLLQQFMVTINEREKKLSARLNVDSLKLTSQVTIDEDSTAVQDPTLDTRDMDKRDTDNIELTSLPNENSNNSNNNKRISQKREIISENILAFAQTTPEFDVQTAVQQIIFNPQSGEGNTRNIFIDTITKNKNLSQIIEIRNFIDGMLNHIATSRGNELCLIYIMKSNVPTPSLEAEFDFCKFLTENQLIKLIFIIYKVVEESVIVPLIDSIVSIYDNIVEAQFGLLSRVSCLRDRSQEAWGVPTHLCSPLKWQNAIFELSNLENNLNPTSMMNALSRTSKAIYSEFKHVILSKMNEEQRSTCFLGADDFVPIFIYVFCQSSIKRPLLVKEMLWNLSHPCLLHGECGYYLTVYESAIECVLNETLSETEEQTLYNNNNNNSNNNNSNSSNNKYYYNYNNNNNNNNRKMSKSKSMERSSSINNNNNTINNTINNNNNKSGSFSTSGEVVASSPSPSSPSSSPSSPSSSSSLSSSWSPFFNRNNGNKMRKEIMRESFA